MGARARCSRPSSMYLFWKESSESMPNRLDTKSAQPETFGHLIDTCNQVVEERQTMESLNLERWGRPLDPILRPTQDVPADIQTIGH